MTDPFAGLDACVHCGFCLQSCPTFLATGDEADSPRGRIRLMQGLARADIAPGDAALQQHLDRCLGCRACEPACPSGVRYGPALEASRNRLARERGVPLLARALLAVMAEPALRAPVLGIARAVRPLARLLAGNGRLRFALGMLGATRPLDGRRASRTRTDPPTTNADATEAAVFAGCIQRGLLDHVNDATRRTLIANGYRVIEVEDQQCCGALHAHAGLSDGAVRLARANVRAFSRVPETTIVVNSAGCGAHLEAYPDVLAGDPLEPEARALAARVVDVSEALRATGPRPGASLPLRVAYDPPCHLLHAQRVTDPPRRMLDAIPDLAVTPHDEPDQCCGGAGIYTLLEPRMSRAVLDRKVAALVAARPDVVATGNPGCVMQLAAGLRATNVRIPVVHPVELLDRSYARAGRYGPVPLDSPGS